MFPKIKTQLCVLLFAFKETIRFVNAEQINLMKWLLSHL